MRLVTYRKGPEGTPCPGALLGTEILEFTAAGIEAPADYLGWFDLAGPSLLSAKELVRQASEDGGRLDALRAQGAVIPRGEVELLAPVPRPGKVICIGLNYHDHAKESGMDVPEFPCVFSKFPTSVVGSGADIVLPPGCEEADYEAELGIVIGRTATRISEQDAYEHILGYTNVNDFTARDFQFADTQWQRGKSPDTFAPVGEYIATTDEVPDPHVLRIRLRLNGETMQDSNTDQLIFGVPALVAYLSSFTTLEPGDVIATGTPPGVGFARKPPVYVRSGDRVEVEIEGLGVLGNPVT